MRHCLRALILLLALFAGSRGLAQTSQQLQWSVEANGETLGERALNFRWDTISSSDPILNIRYSKTFRHDSITPKPILYLVVPPSWVGYTVYVNGLMIFESPSDRFVGNIFESKIILLTAPVTADDIHVEIKSSGHRLFGGFRGESIQFLDNHRQLVAIKVRNFFVSSIHTPISVISLVLSLFIIVLMRAQSFRRTEYYFLILAIVCSIPYTLLSTDIYALLNAGPIFPFKLQQAFQIIMWMSIILFFVDKTMSSDFRIKVWMKKGRFLFFLYLAPVVLLLLIPHISTEHFLNITSIIFPLLVLVSTFTLFFMDKSRILRGLFALVILSAIVGVYSEIVRANDYPLVYAFLAISIAGSLVLLSDIKKGANHTAAVNGFVDQFLPHSTHHEITRLVAKGHSNERIAEELHRVDVVGTVLIDICEWGKLNILGSEKISMKAIFRSRVMAFGVFEEIMSRYDFELIKTSGDNMKFSCGLYQAMDNKDSWVSERILKAIPAIMDALYSLNSDLRKEDLPTLEIKIAASMGNTGYGIEKYASRGQFDTQGHFVNVAYRLESAMNSEFYGMFGRNCALIFESVFKASTQASLALKYEHTHIVNDKYGEKYPCRVYSNKVKVDAEGLGASLQNYFKPIESQPAPVATYSDVIPINKAKGEQRESDRERAYLGEKCEASFVHEGQTHHGIILDFNSAGLGLAFRKDVDISCLIIGSTKTITTLISGQRFQLDVQVTRRINRTIRKDEFQIVGCQIYQPQRLNKPKKVVRYDLRNVDLKPMVSIKNITSMRNTIRGVVVNLTNEGFAVETKRSHVPLIQGMILDLVIEIPHAGSIQCRAQFTRTDVLENRTFRMIFMVIEGKTDYLAKIGFYLIACNLPNVTPASLKKDGFQSNKNAESYITRYADSDEDFLEICRLRMRVFNEMNPTAPALTPEEMADPFDSQSRHFMIFHGDRLICSSRSVFNGGDVAKAEHMQYDISIPKHIIKGGFVEFSRAAVDPDYRGGDVFQTILYHFGRITYETGHSYAVVSCNEALYRKIYKRVGFKRFCDFSDEGTNKWILTAADVRSLIELKTIAPVGYELFMKDLVGYFNQQGIVKKSLRGSMNKVVLKSIGSIVRKKIAS